jgi:acyl-CoA synthetase (AMP-forming)/AMP-acid ligase II
MHRPDGNYAITDRKKDMYLVGGFNVLPRSRTMLSHLHIGVVIVGMPDDRSAKWGCS